MRDHKRYWDEVREVQAGLPEFVWLLEAGGTEVGNLPVQVRSEVAARLIHEKSHRLASEDEVRSHRDRESACNQRLAREKLQRDGVVVVAV